MFWKLRIEHRNYETELGVASCGDSVLQAVENLKEVVELYLENAEALGLEVQDYLNLHYKQENVFPAGYKSPKTPDFHEAEIDIPY
jgi:predicted RNase H-like HicB family nuclease